MDYGQQPGGSQSPGQHGYPPPDGGSQQADYGGGYQQQPQGGYQAPPKKGGFNWLACCGIGCGVVLVVSILVGVFMWKFIAPFVGMGMDAAKVGEEVQATDLATIQASATWVDDATLAASPEAYEGQWLELSAVLGDPTSGQGNMSGTEGTAYVTENFVMISDISKAPRVANQRESIVAYGKIFVMDLAEMMPMLKKEFEKEMASTPGMPSSGKFVIFIAKSVIADEDVDHGTPEE